MEDVHYSGHIAMPKVQVSLYEFVEQMVKTGMWFTQVLQELVHEIQVRRAGGVSDEVEEKLKEIERNIPQGLAGELEGLSILLKASAA